MTHALVAMTLAVLAGHALGQSTAPAAGVATAVFQVASIKPNRSGDPGSSWNISPGEMAMRNMTLKQLIEIAYNVKGYSLSGPAWMSTERFDINARTPSELVAIKDSQRRAVAFRGAMQGLMAERFKLVVHHETKIMPAYALVVAKGGLKVAPVDASGGSNTTDKNGRITATRVSMERMAEWLARDLDRPVVDKTEASGVFSFKLEYSPEQNRSEPPGDGARAADDSRPSIFTALQEQLGLRLQAQQLPVDIVVVDRVERVPSEN